MPINAQALIAPIVPLAPDLEPIHFTTNDATAWLALDQLSQSNCVAYAAAACIERMRTRADQGAFTRLSVRFLYERMQQYKVVPPPPGAEKGYTKLSQARDALAVDGICSEHTWPDDGAPDEQPSSPAITEGRHNQISCAGYKEVPIAPGREAGTAARVHSELSQHGAVAIALPAFSDSGNPGLPTNWSRADVLKTGEVKDPVPSVESVVPLSGHAVCVVGFEPGGVDKLGGYFIFRNSRGMEFGNDAPLHGPENPPASPGPGFGTISAWHVENYVWEWLSLKLTSTP
jgi:hypothetical protein